MILSKSVRSAFELVLLAAQNFVFERCACGLYYVEIRRAF